MHASSFTAVLKLLFILLPLIVLPTHGRFTQTSCDGTRLACVQQNSNGTWCYSPSPTVPPSLNCTGGEGREPSMIAVMTAHLQQGLSIAYYNGVDNTRLGGPDFSVPSPVGVRLCISGKAGDGSFQTLCSFISGDNTIVGPPINQWCAIAVGQNFVSDGCYIPASAGAVKDAPTSSLATPTGKSANAPTPTLITLAGPTIQTIVTNGVTQTVVLSPQASANSDRSGNNARTVTLPIVLCLFGVIVIALGVFVWWYRQSRRSPVPHLNPNEPPPDWSPPKDDGRDEASTMMRRF